MWVADGKKNAGRALYRALTAFFSLAILFGFGSAPRFVAAGDPGLQHATASNADAVARSRPHGGAVAFHQSPAPRALEVSEPELEDPEDDTDGAHGCASSSTVAPGTSTVRSEDHDVPVVCFRLLAFPARGPPAA